MGETIVNHLPGILVGIAGILTGIAAIINAHKEQKKINEKLQAKVSKGADFQNTFDDIIKKSEFKDKFILELINKDTIMIITNQGKFITKDDDKSIVDCLNRESARKAIYDGWRYQIIEPENRGTLIRFFADEMASISDKSEQQKLKIVKEVRELLHQFDTTKKKDSE